MPEIDAVLARCGGVATRARILTVVTRGQFDHEIRSGQLVSPFSRVVCRPWDADIESIRRRAALTSVGPPATISHLTALAAWGVAAVTPGDSSVHISVPAGRTLRHRDGLTVHRRARFPDVVGLDGLIVTTVAEAVLDSWPLIARAQRRGPAIAAVRQHLVTPQVLSETLTNRGRFGDRRELGRLIGLLADGCESELEIWGHQYVFDVPGLRHGTRQKTVRAGGCRYRLDIAYLAEKVAVELDGSTHRDRREYDTRRDAALAAVGWLTVRFTHARLTRDPEGCRHELLAILARRSP